MYPINIKLLKNDIVLSLEELDLLKNLAQQKERIDIINKYGSYFIELNGIRIFLDDSTIEEEKKINTILRKLNVSELEEIDNENKNLFYEKITAIFGRRAVIFLWFL